jgi:hypothetical protein
LAKKLVANGYGIENARAPGQFRYAVCAPKGWTLIAQWEVYLEDNADYPMPNDVMSVTGTGVKEIERLDLSAID